MKPNSNQPSKIIIRLPSPHKGGQEIFLNWNTIYPERQVLLAPCGTKTGKSFGSAIWMLTEALTYRNLYCVVIAPSYLKCQVTFRYMSRMLPQFDFATILKSKLEIRLANGSFIKFLHGKDAETVIEGENVDRFVIDEAGKINRQVWYSLFTTITQTRGIGIITGTPRGFTWYYELFKKAQSNDPFFVFCQIKTIDSPYVSKQAVETAKRLLPPHLFAQYYEAEFISAGSVFGDLSDFWDHSIKVERQRYWIHPDENQRIGFIIHGLDIAKKKDFTVIYSVSSTSGKLVGFLRTQHMPYPSQVQLIQKYLNKFFPNSENHIRYDQTGVGEAFGDFLNDVEINATIDPVIFTNRSKAEMLTRMMLAIQSGWHKAPMIPVINHEFSTYEITVSKMGAHKFSAPEGEHDDVVSAAMLSLSEAYYADRDSEALDMLTKHFQDGPTADEIIDAYDDEKDDFFDDDNILDDDSFDEDLDDM